MKYGESVFDIVYLLFAVIAGIIILCLRRDKIGKLMGSAVLILGCGDAFHLVPRVLNYFIDADFTALLGIGKLITSLTMTVFYLLMYFLWKNAYANNQNKRLDAAVYALFAIRVILCLMPQNGWITNESGTVWGIVRNVPFVVLGFIIVYLFYKSRKEIRMFGGIWLLTALSFLFYIPVAAAAGLVPALGMLMLPKTVCYMILIWIFLNYSLNEEENKNVNSL
ncbi:MAG: hypothetical protein K6D98_05345 [Clostridiales bacterium]|nr:hypothetical protein [Clostridiales bacterium]